jgi:hypothetical protein
LKEIENDLQRFALLPSVCVRSGVGRLHSKNGCGILVLQTIFDTRTDFIRISCNQSLPRTKQQRNRYAKK